MNWKWTINIYLFPDNFLSPLGHSSDFFFAFNPGDSAFLGLDNFVNLPMFFDRDPYLSFVDMIKRKQLFINKLLELNKKSMRNWVWIENWK